MFIGVIGLSDKKLILPLTQIAKLFYETATVRFDSPETCDFVIDLTSSHKAVGSSQIENLENPCIGAVSQIKDLDSTVADKYHYFRLFLVALQQRTGREQKWGVLTGIRPNKLWHKQMQIENGSMTQAMKHLQGKLFIHPEKLNLLAQITNNQLRAVPDLYDLKKSVSIYIGIPFCPTKCAYCTFPAYSIHGYKKYVDRFVDCLIIELQATLDWLSSRKIDISTIYFGGGTPTSLRAEQLARIFEVIDKVDFVREITVEAGRPDTLTENRMHLMRQWGIERISINPQSFHKPTLQAIGRNHSPSEVIEKFYRARALGFSTINMDLIIGLPGEDQAIFKQTLQTLEQLQPEAITVHTLAWKRASEMTMNKEQYNVPTHREAEKMMATAQEWLKTQGYAPYYLYRQQNILGNLENIGYAKPGHESIYNIFIMEEMQTIIGVGCGAVSKFIDAHGGITRYANPKDPKAYIENNERYIQEKLEELEKCT